MRLSHTVYRFYDSDGVLLYVGMSMSVLQRWNDHALDKVWWPEVTSVRVDHFHTEAEARQRELQLIRTLGPRENIMGLPRPPRPLPEGFDLTAEDVAARLGLGAGAIRNHAHEFGGELVDGRWLFRYVDVLAAVTPEEAA